MRRFTFRHIRTGRLATIVADSQEAALAALTPYPEAWELKETTDV